MREKINRGKQLLTELASRADKLLPTPDLPQKVAKRLHARELEVMGYKVGKGKTTSFTDKAYPKLQWGPAECIREFLQNLLDAVRDLTDELLNPGRDYERQPYIFAARSSPAGGAGQPGSNPGGSANGPAQEVVGMKAEAGVAEGEVPMDPTGQPGSGGPVTGSSDDANVDPNQHDVFYIKARRPSDGLTIVLAAVEVLGTKTLLLHQRCAAITATAFGIASTKAESSHYSGGHGEGMKIAALKLLMRGYQVTLAQHKHAWRFSLKNKPLNHRSLAVSGEASGYEGSCLTTCIIADDQGIRAGWQPWRFLELSLPAALNWRVGDTKVLLPKDSGIRAGCLYVMGIFICEDPYLKALGVSLECPHLTVVRDRCCVQEDTPAEELEEHLGEWAWEAKDKPEAALAFEHPRLEFLQAYITQQATERYPEEQCLVVSATGSELDDATADELKAHGVRLIEVRYHVKEINKKADEVLGKILAATPAWDPDDPHDQEDASSQITQRERMLAAALSAMATENLPGNPKIL